MWLQSLQALSTAVSTCIYAAVHMMAPSSESAASSTNLEVDHHFQVTNVYEAGERKQSVLYRED